MQGKKTAQSISLILYQKIVGFTYSEKNWNCRIGNSHSHSHTIAHSQALTHALTHTHTLAHAYTHSMTKLIDFLIFWKKKTFE